jgi:hypothetical protein
MDTQFELDIYERIPEPTSCEIDACWACGKEMESALQFNPDASLQLLAALRQRGESLDAVDVQALTRGLLCTDCMEAEICPNCEAIGGEKIDVEDRDESVGYRAEERKCSFCVNRTGEDFMEMVRRGAHSAYTLAERKVA